MTKTLIFLWNVFATFCLGIALLMPIFNVYLLNEVIRQETGINTQYYKFGRASVFRENKSK